MPFSTPSYKQTVTAGVATYLAENGLASWDDFGNGTPYTSSTEWPIFLGPNMPATPNRLICLTPGVQSFVRADVTTSIQIRLRGSMGATSDEVEAKAQAIHDLFYPNGFPLAHVTLGTIRAGAVLPGDMLPVERDSNRRHGHIQSIRVRSRRPRPE